jgi:hypothetical protein
MRSLSRIAFDKREERVVSDLARWLGLLGRFQILGATFIFIMLLAVAALVSAAELLEPAAGAASEQPLVSIGEVSRTAIGLTVVAVVAFTLVFFRGGMLLVSAAEDLETVTTKDERDGHFLDGAIRKLRAYFVLESMLMVIAAACVYAATILGWGA